MKQKIEHIKRAVLAWYHLNKRELPWRETKDPYKIWVSEIILQQTQVKTGLDYYLRFISAFPTVKSLADADEESVLKIWQGLGYYSRARNMHFAAKQIINSFNGVFPSRYNQIISLKGVGEYTAAAVASIAYGLPYAVVDGNVIRVLSRLFGIEDPVDTSVVLSEIKTLANTLLDKRCSGDFNQAMMEFGALQCTPAKPQCDSCVLSSECLALRNETVGIIPFKSKKLKQRTRYFYYLVIDDGAFLWMQKRAVGDIWQGLYEFPLIECDRSLSAKRLRLAAIEKQIIYDNSELFGTDLLEPIKHVLSHQIIQVSFVVITNAKALVKFSDNWLKIEHEHLKNYPVAKITETFLARYLKV